MLRRPPRSTRTEHTLSLHDALPISTRRQHRFEQRPERHRTVRHRGIRVPPGQADHAPAFGLPAVTPALAAALVDRQIAPRHDGIVVAERLEPVRQPAEGALPVPEPPAQFDGRRLRAPDPFATRARTLEPAPPPRPPF